MWRYGMATNPYGLTAILCAWAGLLGEPCEESRLLWGIST